MLIEKYFIIIIQILFSRYSVSKKVKLVHNHVIIANAAVSKGYQLTDKFLRGLGIGWYLTYYFFNQTKANLQCKQFFISPKPEVAREVWNLLETKPMLLLSKLALQPISFRRKLYLKRTDPEISLELIREYLNNCKDGNYFLNRYSYLSGDKRFNGRKLLEKVNKANQDCMICFKKVMSKLNCCIARVLNPTF
jgi:hypothetical protein